MKHYPEKSTSSLTPALEQLLRTLRQSDGFDVKAYAHAKAQRLNEYLGLSRLKSCVVAVSGGVDSALVLALVALAQQLPQSPIERIVPVLLPVHTPGAATNQDEATARGLELCQALGLTPALIDLTTAHATAKALVDNAMCVQGQGWASGQLVAYQRTPALYYVTSLLAQQGQPGVLVGTTNEDEGAYLGYFGKASDGLVDLQLISDIPKSRVYEVARHLSVPDSILNAIPTGDMYDGRVDEEVFGAPYDFVELFQRFKKNPALMTSKLLALDVWSQAQFAELAQSLEALHRYNAHKYLGRSPAIHLDLWDVSFPGSWKYAVFQGQDQGNPS